MAHSSILSRTPPSAVTATTILTSQLVVETRGKGFVDLTAEIEKFLAETKAREGAVTLFIRQMWCSPEGSASSP